MKKRLFVIFLILLLCFPIVSKALATNSSYDNIKVYLFYRDDYEDWDKAQEWLENELKEHERVRPEFIEINDNKDLFNQVKEALDIKKDNDLVMIIGSNYFIGYNSKVESDLIDAIRAYEESTDYCDLVAKLQNKEGTKECIKQNEGIYEQTTNIFMYVVVAIVLIGILVFIGVLMIFKKRKNRAY